MRGLLVLAALVAAAPAVAQTVQRSRADTIARGRYIVETIGACGNCHTQQRMVDGRAQTLPGLALAGGTPEDAPFGRWVAPNITPDVETGIGRWTEAQIAVALREGKRPDGSTIGPPMPFAQLRHLSDADAAAIAAYLKSIRPIRRISERSAYRMPLPPAWGPPLGQVPAPADTPVARGEYLVNLGHCMDCHTPMLPGGRRDEARTGAGGFEMMSPNGIVVTPNITSDREHGLGAWTDAQIGRAITAGVSADGRRLSPPMGYAFYHGMRQADLTAITTYLRRLPPRP